VTRDGGLRENEPVPDTWWPGWARLGPEFVKGLAEDLDCVTQLADALVPTGLIGAIDDPLELGLQCDQASETALERSVDLEAVSMVARPHACCELLEQLDLLVELGRGRLIHRVITGNGSLITRYPQ
jgi:hypothetical protein